jgi:hypothetical protein
MTFAAVVRPTLTLFGLAVGCAVVLVVAAVAEVGVDSGWPFNAYWALALAVLAAGSERARGRGWAAAVAIGITLAAVGAVLSAVVLPDTGIGLLLLSIGAVLVYKPLADRLMPIAAAVSVPTTGPLRGLETVSDDDPSPTSAVGSVDSALVAGRVRPLWLVALLSFLTFDVYQLWWFYATWAELKAVRRDSSMHPGWHGLSMLVPFYGWSRFREHMRYIRELAQQAGVPTSLNPGRALVIWILSTVMGRMISRLQSMTPEVELTLHVVSGAIVALILVWAQGTLNAVWRTAAPRPPTRPVHPGELIVLVLGGVASVFYVLSILAP